MSGPAFDIATHEQDLRGAPGPTRFCVLSAFGLLRDTDVIE